MDIQNLYPGSWGSNCYVLTSGKHAAIVDPSADAAHILETVQKAGAVPDFILLTHGHFDHIVSLDRLRTLASIPAYIHKEDADMPEDANKNAFYTFFHMNRTYRPPEHTLSDGTVLHLGEETIRVLHTPGHTKGSVCYMLPNGSLLTGDTLFAESYGRCDLYGGDEQALFASLSKLRSLPPQTVIYPGHGDSALLQHALDNCFY